MLHSTSCHTEGVRKILVGIQSTFHSGAYKAEHNRTSGSTFWGIGKQEIFPVDDKGLDTPFRPVIGYLQPATEQK